MGQGVRGSEAMTRDRKKGKGDGVTCIVTFVSENTKIWVDWKQLRWIGDRRIIDGRNVSIAVGSLLSEK